MVAELAPATPSYNEGGYVVQTDWDQWIAGEKVPDLQWPRSIEVFSRMAREDGRVNSLMQAIGLPIRSANWRIDPNGARDEVTEFVASALNLPIKDADPSTPKQRQRGRFSWDAHMQLVIQGELQYGHAFFEQVYRLDEQGRATLRKLAPRPQATISKMLVARDGGLVAIRQHPPMAINDGTSPALTLGLPNEIEIPVSRLVAYVRDQEPGLWIGRSLLRPAYKHWLLKDQLMRIQTAAAQRNGMGVPVATGAENASDEDIQKLQRMASSFTGGLKSGVGLPFGAMMQLLGVQGNLPDLQSAIDYQDKQIALAGLAHFLNLDGGGSYALASVQENTFSQSVHSFATTIADVANAHVIEDLVDINFGEDEPAPRLVFDKIGSQFEVIANSLKTLYDAGILMPDRILEESVRADFGLPAKALPSPSDIAPPADTPAPPSGPPEGQGDTGTIPPEVPNE